jgi:peptidoglycan/xylan/chitin deacetylase (PgdA/CDA1 family)
MGRVVAFPRNGTGVAPSAETGSSGAPDVVDRVGLGLALGLVGWTLIAAGLSGGEWVGPTLLLLAATATYWGARLAAFGRPALVPAVVVAIAAVLVVALPFQTFGSSATTPVLGYANAKAAFFILASVAALMLAALASRSVHRILAFVAAAAYAIVPLVTQARAATLVSVALPIAAVLAMKRASARVTAVVGSVVLLAAVVGTVFLGATDRDLPAVDLLGPRRVELWGQAVDLITENPIVGVGPGRFGEESALGRSDADARWAHHEFLQQGAETGIPGSVLLLALFLWGFVRLATAGAPGSAVLGATGLAALGILACFDYVLHFPVLTLTAASLVGAASPRGEQERRWRPGPALRKAAKGAALPGGLIRRRGAEDVVILLYHRVGAGEREIDVPIDLFRRHVESLQEREPVLSLDQALGGRGGVVLSFDDGFADFHDHVLPVLTDRGIPAILYLATGLVGVGPEGLHWSQLEDAISTGLVTIGSHTHSHSDLSRATESEAGAEMDRSRGLIEDRLGVPCRHFAYPWAVASTEAESAARTRFDSAALGAWRTNRRGRIYSYRLGRTPVLRNDGVRFFRAKARGMLDGEGFAYRLLRRGPWDRG